MLDNIFVSFSIPQALNIFHMHKQYLFLKNFNTFFCLKIPVPQFLNIVTFKNKIFSLFQLPKMLAVSVKYFLFLLKKYFLCLFSSFKIKLIVFGSGYFFSQLDAKIIQLVIGFSHSFVYIAPDKLTIKVLGRKQRLLTLQSYDFDLLIATAQLLKKLKTPDIYRGKGIRFLKEKIKLKKGKKKFV